MGRLLVGSEGTLALFTEATLRTIPLPASRAVVLLGFARLESALRAARLAVMSGPVACDLLDRRLLSVTRRVGVEGISTIPAAVGAALVVSATRVSVPPDQV